MPEEKKPEEKKPEENKPKEEAPEATPDAAKPAGGFLSGTTGKIVMFAGIGLVVIGASVGGTLAFLGQSGSDATTAESGAATDSAEAHAAGGSKPKAVALYHNLRPAFIVNYLAGNKPRYLQAELTVVARDQAVVDSVVTYTPAIRGEVLNLFADQDYATLQTEEGKQALRQLLKERIDAVLVKEKQESGIESVMLTSFVMQ